MNFSSKAKKFGQSPVAAACVSLVIGMTSASALAQATSFGINFPTAMPNPTEITLGAGTFGLDHDFTSVTGMAGVTIPVQSVQTLYTTTAQTLAASVASTAGAGGILNIQSGGGTVTANVSDNSIAASGTGNQLTLASGGSVATIDLGLMSTSKSIGALAVQFLGSQNTTGQVNVQANVSGSTVGALFNGMYAAPIAVNSNVVKAASTLNDATTVVAGAVPLGFADSTGGSSSIYFNGTSDLGGGDMTGGSQSTLGITTVQNSVNGGISAGVDGDGSYAALTDDTIAIKTQETYDFGTWTAGYETYLGQVYTDLSSPLTLNNNTQSAAFTGNNATSVLQADATSNAFSGSASVTNAQSNVETLNYAGGAPTAQVSNSQIIADLTYAGVDGSGGVSPTEFTSSLSVSGTALAPQSISAQSIGNAAGSLNSAGELTSSGNAIEFNNSAVDLNGNGNGSYYGDNSADLSSGRSEVSADLIVNSAQVNQRPSGSGSGVDSLVQGSGITAAVDRLAATGSVSVNYDAVTSGATGNLAGNLINAQGSNITASMAVVGTQQNASADVAAQNLGSRIGVGIGDAAVGALYTVADRAVTTAVLGSVTVNNDAIGAVAQGNLAANTLLASAGNTLTSQYNGYFGEDYFIDVNPQVTAGLVAVNVQGNTDSATYANVSGGSIFIAGVDQAGSYAGNLVPLGAATLSASSNRISALAQGNNGGTNIGASAGGAIVLTAAAANSQVNDIASPVIAALRDSSVLVSGLSSVGTTIATNSNTLTTDATGNLGANAINISGGSTVDGQASDNTSDLQNRQGNSGGITAMASGSAVGVRLGAESSNVESYPWGGSTTASATGADPYTSSALSSTTGDYTSMMARNVTTLAGSTLAIDDSTVAANATANQVDNRASLSGTTLGGSAAVASVIGSTQNSYGEVSSSVASTDVGVRLEDQSLTVSSTPTYGNTATTSNSFYPGLGEDSNVDLTSASAVAGNSVSGSASGNITAIDTTTVSVSASTLAAASNGNVASNALRLSGTDVTLQSGSSLAVGNNQNNSSLGTLTASVSDANVGVLVGDDISGVTGTGTSSLIGSVTATVQPTTNLPGPSGLFSGSGSATIATPVTGSMTAVGMYALTAQVDDSVLSASSVANSADNRIIVDATVLGAAATARADVINQQANSRTFSGGLSAVNLGVVLADVTASQTTTASGSSTAIVVATDNAGGSSVANGLNASTTLSASGSASALGVNGSTVSVQRSALTASAKGNTATNVVDLGSTVASAFAAQINEDSGDQSNFGAGSATISDVALGTVLGDVAATSTTTSTALTSGSGSATDAISASTTGGSAIASGSATAVVAASGLLNSTSTVSGNSLSAAVFGNEAINVVSGSGTVIGAVSGLPAVSLFNKQFNHDSLTSDAGAVQLGTVVGAVSGTGSALANSTASGSATALATDSGTNGEATSGDVTSGATANANTTVTATGINGLTAASNGNLVGAVNTGNSATNAIRLASTTITGSTGDKTLFNNNSQFNSAGLSASADNVGLGVLLTSVDATGSATASSGATADATATNNNTSDWARSDFGYISNSATATASGGATSTASGSATAVGITATNASVATNVLRAANTGNSASTVTSLSASSLTGAADIPTVLGSSTQTNQGNLVASLGELGGVTVGVSSGAVSARFTASGSASATATTDSTAYNYYYDIFNDVNSSTDSGTATSTSYANASGNATATATGMTGSTLSVLSNQLEASNMGNSAYTSTVLDGTVLGTATAPVSARASNTQTNYGDGTATAGNISLGVMQGDVSATASGSATYDSSPSVDAFNNASGSNTATSTASAYGIVNSTLSVGGTQAAPQTVTAQSVGNSATTLVAVTQTTGSGASGSTTLSVISIQENDGYQSATVGGDTSPVTVGVKVGDVTATADASVAVTRAYTSGAYNYTTQDEIATTTAAGISGGSSSVQYNTLAAKTFGNSASNSLTSTTATNLAGSTAEVATFSATNIQNNTAGASATVAAADIGVVVGAVSASSSAWNAYETAVAIDAAQLAVSNNQSLATSIGNVADNSLAASAAVAGSSTLPFGSLVTSGQTNDGSQEALLDALRVGVFTGTVEATNAYGIKDSSLTVNANQLQAATYGNSATNVNQVLASAVANLDDVVIRNTQTNNESAIGASTVSNSTVGVSIAGAWDGALESTPTTVQANTLAALSYGNSATNATSVSGGTTLTVTTLPADLEAFETLNTQTNQAAMTSAASAIEVGVMIGTGFNGTSSGYGVVASPLVVKDNAVSAMNYANQATNSLNLTAGNVIDGDDKLAQVSSTQTNSGTGSAAATVSAVDVGVIVNADWTDIANSDVTVDGNRLTAASYLNTASNSLSLAAQTLSATPATVSNAQTNNATGSGAISAVNVGVFPAGGASDWQELNGVTSAVSNNALNAQAGGNTASNVLNATASATIAGGSTPTFQVLNSQSNTGVMTASISDAMVGNWGNTGSNYYGGTTMTVSMNSAVANAYGNTASNALSMSALTGSSNGASTGLSNSQSNTASLSATVSGVLMGVGSGRGDGTVGVSGNSIVASTVGNAASNRVGIAR